MGFEISAETVRFAAQSLGREISLEDAAGCLKQIDRKAVYAAALEHANDLDGQATAAKQDIMRQLGDIGLEAPAPQM
jgi:ribosomal protein L28